MSHLELGGVFAFIGGSLCDLLVLSLSLNSAADGLFLIVNALLEFNDSVLPVALLLLNVLHQVVEDALGLKALFLGFALLVFLQFEHFLLVFETILQIGALYPGSDVILLHSLQHMCICSFCHLFLFNLCLCGFNCFSQLLESCLVSDHWGFGKCFLLLCVGNLLLYLVEISLSHSDFFLGVVMLLLDLLQLSGHFIDLISVVLISCRVVGRVKNSVHLDESL